MNFKIVACTIHEWLKDKSLTSKQHFQTKHTTDPHKIQRYRCKTPHLHFHSIAPKHPLHDPRSPAALLPFLLRKHSHRRASETPRCKRHLRAHEAHYCSRVHCYMPNVTGGRIQRRALAQLDQRATTGLPRCKHNLPLPPCKNLHGRDKIVSVDNSLVPFCNLQSLSVGSQRPPLTSAREMFRKSARK